MANDKTTSAAPKLSINTAEALMSSHYTVQREFGKTVEFETMRALDMLREAYRLGFDAACAAPPAVVEPLNDAEVDDMAFGYCPERIALATVKADDKVRKKPALLFATYCPMCGKKLEAEGDSHGLPT